MELPLGRAEAKHRHNTKIKGPVYQYACTVCEREVGRDNLVAKRVHFRGIGMGSSDRRSRVIAWLCIIPHQDGTPSCLDQDEHWNLPEREQSPGEKAKIDVPGW